MKLIKILITISLGVAIYLFIDWEKSYTTILRADPRWLLGAVCCVLFARLFISWRWQRLLAIFGDQPSIGSLFLVVSGGFGLGSFLPTSIGPDIARGLILKTATSSQNSISTNSTISSLVLDRYTSTIGTLIVALIGSAVLGKLVLSFILILSVIAILVLPRWGFVLLVEVQKHLKFVERFLNKAKILNQTFDASKNVLKSLIFATLISIFVTLFRVGLFICIYRAFGSEIPVVLALLTIPLLLVTLMLPVTIGGFGIREWFLVLSFQSIGIPPEVSVSAGVASFFLQFLVSVPALAYITWARIIQPKSDLGMQK